MNAAVQRAREEVAHHVPPERKIGWRADPPPAGCATPSGFAALCGSRAQMIADGDLLVCEAVDELQAIAERTGLIAAIGQDAVQNVMAEAIALVDVMRCEAEAAGHDELAEAFETEIMLRAADLVRRWELDDPRSRGRYTGEPRPSVPPPAPRWCEPRGPPQSTVDAFWHVVALDDVDRLKAWLADHPKDAPILLKLLESRLC